MKHLEEQGFIVRENIISGDKVYLIFPQHIGIKWTEDNLIYRSSIWTEDGKPVSLSFKKFFNWGENYQLIPEPSNITKTIAKEKIDGSLLIVSKYKGTLITRTRGTFDVSSLENGFELETFKKKYPKLFDNDLLNSEQYTLLCEWVSPFNRIVLDYGTEPDLFFIGCIKHENYSYLKQSELNNIAQSLNMKRPTTYTFKDINDMVSSIQALKNKEGVCLYFNDEQDIKKIKSIDYLTKHHFKSNLNMTTLLDLYVAQNTPDYGSFLTFIETSFDFECMNMSIPLVSKIVDAKKEIDKFLEHAKLFVNGLKNLSRKEAALKIISSYGDTCRTGVLFKLLDNKSIDQKTLKILIQQVI